MYRGLTKRPPNRGKKTTPALSFPVMKARRLHGATIKGILYPIVLITGPLSIVFVWLDFFWLENCIPYMFTSLGLGEAIDSLKLAYALLCRPDFFLS